MTLAKDVLNTGEAEFVDVGSLITGDLESVGFELDLLGDAGALVLAEEMGPEEYRDLGSDKTLDLLQTMGVAKFGQLDLDQMLGALKAVDTGLPEGDSIPEDIAITALELLSPLSLDELGPERMSQLVSFVNPENVSAMESDQAIAVAESIVVNPDAIAILESKTISALVSQIAEQDGVDQTTVSDLVSNIEPQDLIEMPSSEMENLLTVLDAEYFGDQILSFDDLPPIETFVTDNLITPPEAFLELMRSDGVIAIF